MQSESAPRGVLLVLAAAVLWGTTGTAQSFAPTTLAPVWVGAWRLVLAALFFVAVIAASAVTPHAVPLSRALAGLRWRAVVGAALCMTAYNLTFFAGVRASGIAVGTAIALGSGPVWAGLLQAALGAGAPRGAWWAGTALAVGGGALMVLGPGAATKISAPGIGLCLLAGLSYAVYATLNRRLVASATPGVVTGAVFTLAALFALPLARLIAGAMDTTIGSPADAARSAAVFVWLGVGATGVAYLCFSHALRHIPVATAVTLALAEPLTAFVLALVVVGERPGPSAFVGLLAVIGGLAIVIRAALRTARTKLAE